MNKKILESLKPELLRCKTDIIYFAKKYCKVEHPLQGVIPFELYDFQEKTLTSIMDYDRNIILKSRQMGISTLTAMRCLHMMLFEQNKNILVIAIDEKTAINLIRKVKLMYDNLPPFFKAMIPRKEDNKTSFVLKNESRIKATGATENAGRSEALSLLLIDECAFIRDIESIWTSAQATLSRGGSVIMLSTPNGTANFFHKMWTNAESGVNGFNFIKLPWYLHPEQDQAFRDRQTIELGEKKAAQEYDCIWGKSKVKVYDLYNNKSFNSSLETLFSVLSNDSLGDIHYNDRFKVLTPTGYQSFTAIQRRKNKNMVSMKLNRPSSLSIDVDIVVSNKHKFIVDGNEVLAKNINICDSLTDYIVVIDKQIYTDDIYLYDLVEVDNGNVFIVDDVVSHNCDFSTSGNSLIEHTILNEYKKLCNDPIETRYNNEFWIWNEANNKNDYVVAVDVARGNGLDYSTVQVLEVNDIRQVAEYKGQVDTKLFASRIVSIAREYNNAMLVVENNSIGWAVIQDVLDMGYDNVYYSKSAVNVVDDESRAYKHDYRYSKQGMVPGFTMSHISRELVIDKLSLYFREMDHDGLYTTKPIINSIRLINELYSFVWDGKKTQAAKGYNDDLVMAMAIGLYTRDFAVRIRGAGSNVKMAMLRNIKKVRKDGSYTNDDPWKMKVGNGDSFDLRSLLNKN